LLAVPLATGEVRLALRNPSMPAHAPKLGARLPPAPPVAGAAAPPLLPPPPPLPPVVPVLTVDRFEGEGDAGEERGPGVWLVLFFSRGGAGEGRVSGDE